MRRRLSSTSQRRAVPRYPLLRARSGGAAAARWERRMRRGGAGGSAVGGWRKKGFILPIRPAGIMRESGDDGPSPLPVRHAVSISRRGEQGQECCVGSQRARVYNAPHETGGSSSGCTATVAAGEVDISFGGDQGGSIRIPAAFCGIIGYKPTFGLVSHFGIGFGSDQSIDYTGPMARTVEDAAAALQATAGYDTYDPRQTRDVPTSMDVLGRLADVRDLVLAAVDVLARTGADVAKVSIPAHHAIRTAQSA